MSRTAIGGMGCIPISHRTTVLRVTPSCAASASWVSLSCARMFLSWMGDIFALLIPVRGVFGFNFLNVFLHGGVGRAAILAVLKIPGRDQAAYIVFWAMFKEIDI